MSWLLLTGRGPGDGVSGQHAGRGSDQGQRGLARRPHHLLGLLRLLHHHHLLRDGRELEGVQRLVKQRGALVHVDDHGRLAFTTEEALEQARQFALSERHHLGVRPVKRDKCFY